MLKSDINGGFDYVAVEVIENQGTKVTQIECGLFMGIITHVSNVGREAKFLTLQVSDTGVRMYNLNEFNVLSIGALDKDMHYLTVYRNTAEEQKDAVTVLSTVVNEMGKSNRLFDTTPGSEMIDVDTFKNVPLNILTTNTLSGNVEGNLYGKSTTYHRDVYDDDDYSIYNYRKPEKPTVLSFKRKGKLPAKENLDKMLEMVKAVTAGEFDVGKIPIPQCDVVVEEAAPVKAAGASV